MSFDDSLQTKEENEFKIHFADFNQVEKPLDVFLRSQKDFQSWNEYKNKRKRFHKYIFTLVNFYHEKDTWLFAGIYEVLSNDGDKHEVKLLSFGDEYIGRLKILYEYKSRTREPNLVTHYDKFVVKEILKERFVGREFTALDNVSLSFVELENIYNKDILSWKNQLQNVKGVYLITDKKNGKKYVGSAYEEKEGIWARWGVYKETGHGKHSKILKKLINKNGISYARKYFSFTLLEHFPLKTDNNLVTNRENYWKETFLTRQFGYNKN